MKGVGFDVQKIGKTFLVLGEQLAFNVDSVDRKAIQNKLSLY